MQFLTDMKDYYHSGVDFKFLESMGIRYVMHQPWQIGLFHEELTGKFLWYPVKGTLMFEQVDHPMTKIGKSGDFIAGGFDNAFHKQDPNATENVYNEIIKMVNKQNS